MDIAKCLLVSALELYGLGTRGVVSPTPGAFALLFFSQYLVVKTYCWVIYPRYLSPLRHLPGPKDGSLIFGQILNQFTSPDPNDMVLSWMERWPHADLIRYLMFGGTEFLVVNSIKAMHEIAKTHCYAFIKPPFLFRTSGSIIGRGIFFAEGDEHKRQKRSLAGPFLNSNTKKLLPIFDTKALHLCSKIQQKLKSNPYELVEVYAPLKSANLDAIGLAILGYEIGSLDGDSEFERCYSNVFDLSLLSQVMSLINQWFPIRTLLPIEANRTFVRSTARIKSMIQSHVRRRVREIQAHRASKPTEPQSADLLTLMINEDLDHSGSCSEELLVSQLRTFMVAGHESSTNTLLWALHSLSIHPDVQGRLREEITANLPDSGPPTTSAIDSLEYLDRFVKEVFRLYPALVWMPRQADVDIEICGTVIPKGTIITLFPSVIQLNKTIWGPTADQFDPDRWTNLPETAKSPWALLTFYGGPRGCIGKGYAVLEIKVMLTRLVREFKFAPGQKSFELLKEGHVYKPVGGLKMKIRPVP